VRFGILRVRVTTIDPTGRPGPFRHSFRDTARTRSVLANPDPRFATTQRTSWLQFPLLLGRVLFLVHGASLKGLHPIKVFCLGARTRPP
jgi:hypothetical protein